MNLFTSALDKKLLVYCSLPNPMAWREDVFLVPWDTLDVYAFPHSI